jgi:hypothetical protein
VTITQAYNRDRITATGSGVSGTSNRFTVNAPPKLSSFSITVNGGTPTAGTAFSITITAQDQYGNAFTGFNGTVTLTDSSGTITPTTSPTFVNGVCTMSVTVTKAYTSLLGLFGGDVITATETGNTAVTGSSSGFSVNAAAATKLVFTTVPAAFTHGTGSGHISGVFTITLEDQYGNTATSSSNVVVTLTSTSSTGTFYSNAGGTTKITQVTITSGQSTANFYYGDTAAGKPTITAASSGLTSATTTITVN